MEDKLWGLSNIVTGFAIVQALTFLYALDANLHNLQTLEGQQRIGLAFGIVVFSVSYLIAIWRLGTLGARISSSDPNIWNEVTKGRYAAIMLFTVLSVVGLFAPEIFKRIG